MIRFFLPFFSFSLRSRGGAEAILSFFFRLFLVVFFSSLFAQTFLFFQSTTTITKTKNTGTRFFDGIGRPWALSRPLRVTVEPPTPADVDRIREFFFHF